MTETSNENTNGNMSGNINESLNENMGGASEYKRGADYSAAEGDKGDIIIRGLLFDRTVNISAISGKNLVEKARKTHGLSKVCTAALGRTLLGTALTAFPLKNRNESVTVIIDGGGPAGKIIAVGVSGGIVKGYIEHPETELPPTESNKLDVSGAVGKNGEIRVIRDLSLKEPYIGRCPLASGEIAEDMAKYFLISEQQPSLVYLGVHVEAGSGKTLAASGVIISPLPGCPEENIARLEAAAPCVSELTGLLEKDVSPEAVLKELFSGMDFEITERSAPAFKCDCSRERLEKALISLGRDEIQELINSDTPTEAVCRFCSKAYIFDKDALRRLLREAVGKADADE